MNASRTRSLRTRGLIALLAAVSVFLLIASARAIEPYREDAVKAAFINRFTAYVDWPEAVSSSPAFRVAVMGSPQVADELRKLLADRTIKGRPVRVDFTVSTAAARDAQILYVGGGWTGDLRALVKSLGQRPILLVTEHPRGLDEGAVINFLTVDQRVRFEVSLVAAQRAGLQLNSQLLGFAVRVRGARQDDAP